MTREAALKVMASHDRRAFLLGVTAAALICATKGAADMREAIIAANGLEGTFVRPDGDGPFPAALIIAGSGPTDRDGNNPLGVNAASYKKLADALAAAGIASLRYDKRGIGRSAASAPPEKDMRFRMFIDDAASLAAWLGRQPAMRSVVLVGHSEGALIASVAAKQTTVAGAVLVAAPGRRLGEILRAQLAAAPMPEAARAEAMRILAELEAGRMVETVNQGLYAIFRPSVQPYLISQLSIDPAAEIRSLPLPLLIVRGGRDLQVGQEDFTALTRARPDAETLTLPAMNHVLKDVGEGRDANVRAYADPSLPLAAGLAERVTGFVAKQRGN